MARQCRKCLLSTQVGVSVNQAHLCEYCTGEKNDEWEKRFAVSAEKKREKLREMEELFDAVKGRYAYDCLLAFSGGKDSTYLLHHLINERGLKVLAVHVESPFESKVAQKNVAKMEKALDIELLRIEPGEEFYYRFYRKLFENPVREGYLKTVCYTCGPFIIGTCLKKAAEMKIPLVILGLSPNQPENMFFEWPQETVRKDWTPALFKTPEFDEDFLAHFWNPRRYPAGTPLPRAIAPLHVMPYNADRIAEILEEKGLLNKKRSDPVRTNCDLNWPIIYLDTRLLGYNPYIKEFSALIRRGEKARFYFKLLFLAIEWMIRLKIFKTSTIKKVGEKLGIDIFQCPQNPETISRRAEEYP